MGVTLIEEVQWTLEAKAAYLQTLSPAFHQSLAGLSPNGTDPAEPLPACYTVLELTAYGDTSPPLLCGVRVAIQADISLACRTLRTGGCGPACTLPPRRSATP